GPIPVLPRGVSRYHLVTSLREGKPEVTRRALLVCYPLVTDRVQRVASVVVFYIDLMNRVDRINEAVETFTLADGVEALQKSIVDQVGRMGYLRARLYEYDPKSKNLFGRESIGFDGTLAARFKSHVIDVQKDGEAHNTIDQGYPGLFIYE